MSSNLKQRVVQHHLVLSLIMSLIIELTTQNLNNWMYILKYKAQAHWMLVVSSWNIRGSTQWHLEIKFLYSKKPSLDFKFKKLAKENLPPIFFFNNLNFEHVIYLLNNWVKNLLKSGNWSRDAFSSILEGFIQIWFLLKDLGFL